MSSLYHIRDLGANVGGISFLGEKGIKIMRNNPNYSYNIVLRKSSKIMPPVAIAANCCGTILKIKQKKDFPLKNKKCKCGKQYLIEWELI